MQINRTNSRKKTELGRMRIAAEVDEQEHVASQALFTIYLVSECDGHQLPCTFGSKACTYFWRRENDRDLLGRNLSFGLAMLQILLDINSSNNDKHGTHNSLHSECALSNISPTHQQACSMLSDGGKD